jgi:tRNA(His) 5'-end guanylyltransferase
MALTTMDLVEEFEAQTGYTHSDEITLIFNAKSTELEELELKKETAQNASNSKLKKPQIHMWNGRVQKILSLISSYCSVRFNYHLEKLIEPIESNYNHEFIKLIYSHKQMFDGRILIFTEALKHEILNHQIWRSVHDCERNAISTYAYTHFGPNKILNKTCKEQIKMLEDGKNIFWNSQVPLFIKHGIYCKKSLVKKEINHNDVLRTKYVFKELKINFSSDNLNLLFAKYWNTIDNDGIITEFDLGTELNLDTLSL